MSAFKTWKVLYNADLVSHTEINVALLHELLSKAIRSEAGSIGYLVGEETTALEQTGIEDEAN